MTFNKEYIETEITPESWVIDNLISEFMMLHNQRNAFAVETGFVRTLCVDLRFKSIPDYETLLEHYFQRNIDPAMTKLKEFQSLSILIVNSESKKTKNGKKNTVVITGVLRLSRNHLLSFEFTIQYMGLRGSNI